MVLVARLAAAGCQARNQHNMDEPPQAARSPQKLPYLLRHHDRVILGYR